MGMEHWERASGIVQAVVTHIGDPVRSTSPIEMLGRTTSPADYRLSAAGILAIAEAARGNRLHAEEALRRIDDYAGGMVPGEADVRRAMVRLAMGDSALAMDAFRASWDAGYWVARLHDNRHRMLAGAEAYGPFRALVAFR